MFASELFDFVLIHDTQHRQRAGVVPGVIEQSHFSELRVALLGCNPDELVQALIAERRMRTQRHHEVELLCVVQNFNQRAE